MYTISCSCGYFLMSIANWLLNRYIHGILGMPQRYYILPWQMKSWSEPHGHYIF